jgi:hypothetical protein
MKEPTFDPDIYYVIQPVQFASKLLGLSPWHIDPKYKCYNQRAYVYFHFLLCAIMIVKILYGLCENIIYAAIYRDLKFSRFVCVVWIIAIISTHLTSVLALLLNVTRKTNHWGNVLSTISRVDSKLLRTNFKHSGYRQQRSRILRQLMIQFILRKQFSILCTLVLLLYMGVQYVHCVSGIN